MPTVRDAVEARYDAEPGFTVPGLVELFGAARGAPGVPPADGSPWAEDQPTEQHLEATYVDTAELDLARAGVVVRRRAGGDGGGWQLEVSLPGADRSQVVAADGDGDDVPDRLRTMTLTGARGRPLRPVAQVVTDRTVRRLVDATGRALVEVTDDHVTARGIPGGPGTDAPADATSWREIRVVLVDGPTGLLTAVDGALREQGLTPTSTGSELLRTLGPASVEADRRSLDGTSDAVVPRGKKGGARSPEKASAGDVVVAHLATQVGRIRTQDLPVRLDAPGAVHAMRVATRRARSALTTFDPLFEGTVTRPVGRELRWLAGVLGAARDAEVMRDRLTREATHAPDDVPREATEVGDEVSGELDRAYREAHDRVVAELDGERYRSLLAALEALVEQPSLRKRAARPARDVLPGPVARAWTALRWSMVAADGSTDPDEREELLHDARKAAKRARYAAESVAPVFGTDAEALAAAVERLQEALGEHLETLGARRRLRDLAARTSDAGAAFALGRLHGLEEARGERSFAEVDAAWARASKKRLRRWLR